MLAQKTSSLIPNQFPDHIRENYPALVDFVQDYYKWLEEENNIIYLTKNVLTNQDVDSFDDAYYDHFRNDFLADFPDNIPVDVDKRTLIKHIKEYYRCRGSERSYNLFFKIFFDSYVSFYYPSKDLLKPSDGKWNVNKSIKVKSVSGDPFLLINQKIFGRTSDSTAIVENIQKTVYGTENVYEIFFNNSSLIGFFLPEENITNEDNSIITTSYSTITAIEISNAGNHYTIGDEVNVVGDGMGAKVYVSDITQQNLILSSGSGNFTTDEMVFQNRSSLQGNVTGASQNTIGLENGSTLKDDLYKGFIIEIIGGTGNGYSYEIKSYNAASKTATITTNFIIVPDITSIFKIHYPYTTSRAKATITNWDSSNKILSVKNITGLFVPDQPVESKNGATNYMLQKITGPIKNLNIVDYGIGYTSASVSFSILDNFISMRITGRSTPIKIHKNVPTITAN